jgi:PIN domain nuclease of toxin-antitoxin system
VILLDTHAWLWWVSDPDRLSEPARSAVAAEASIAVSTISVFEVATLHRRGRIELDRDVRDWVSRSTTEGYVHSFLPPTVEVATVAASIEGDTFPGDPADRLIFATAMLAGATLVTKDSDMRAYAPTQTLW